MYDIFNPNLLSQCGLYIIHRLSIIYIKNKPTIYEIQKLYKNK